MGANRPGFNSSSCESCFRWNGRHNETPSTRVSVLRHAVVDTARFVRQHRLEGSPVFVLHDARRRFGGLNHALVALTFSVAVWSLSARKRTRYAHCEFCRV